MEPIDALQHSDELIRELGALNASLTPRHAANYQEYRPDTLVLLCSDARVPVTRLLPGDRFFVVKTAGNVFDSQADLLPTTLRQTVVIGHEHAAGAGCGACDAARAHASDPAQTEQALSGAPELVDLIGHVEPDAVENTTAVIEGLRRSGIVDAGAVYGMMYSHSEAQAHVPDVLPGGRITTAIAQYNAAGRAGFGAVDLRCGETVDMRSGQQPQAIVLNMLAGGLGRSFGHFFPSPQRRYLQPNSVYEAKAPASRLTDILLASLQFALGSALTGGTSFATTAHCLLLTSSEDTLLETSTRLLQEPTLEGFIERGGVLYGLVPGTDLRMRFFAA